MVEPNSPVKVDDSLIKRAEKIIESSNTYYNLKHFANFAFSELLEKLEAKSK